jgi:hypothetical protein
MQIISHDLLYLIRAVLFGIAVGYTFFIIIFYFKPMAEKTFGIKSIDTDIWWWTGLTIAIILGIAGMMLLM